jgi:hypothetical protein
MCFREACVPKSGRPLARTAQEDDATKPYWLDLWGKLDAIAAGILLTSGGGLLWLRHRLRA